MVVFVPFERINEIKFLLRDYRDALPYGIRKFLEYSSEIK